MWFDHVAVAVASLQQACDRYRERYGLGWSGAGRHPQGTITRAIPLSATCYIELLECWDSSLPYGREVTEALAAGRPLLGLAIEVEDIEAVAERVGVRPEVGTVELEDGTLGRWAMVGAGDDLPFFISYARTHAEREEANRDRVGQAAHTIVPTGIAWVQLGGDEQTLRDWIGPTDLDLRLVGGEPGVRRFAIATDGGELVFEP